MNMSSLLTLFNIYYKKNWDHRKEKVSLFVYIFTACNMLKDKKEQSHKILMLAYLK